MIKWVVRLAWLAGILGLAGTLFIIYKISDPKKEVFLTSARSDTLIPRATAKKEETGPVSAAENTFKQTDTISAAKKPGEIEKKISEPITEPTVTKADIKGKEKVSVNKPKPLASKKVGEKDEEKLFTLKELQNIVARVNKVIAQNKLRSNCVQLRMVKANNRRTVAQIETYLRSKSFSIAGRETITEKVKGIRIARKGACVRLTIGSFY